ncbi:G-type lectin S-receptor-like serine/threonine-protein kinase At2g19130 isoform X1 [Panicum virgatum]|nr:G-type lectin S-receptor-like serine/threonine-protein kinase At2g19130 isoform X1 [Panicum virgatum]
MHYALALDTTRRRGFTIQRDGELIFASTFPRWMDIREDGDYGLTFNDMRTYIQLDSSGVVRLTKRGECNSTLWSAPETVCDLDSYCGPYSLCTMSGSCKCPAGFDTPFMEGWTAVGCPREVHLNGESTAAQPEKVFYPIDGIHRYPRDALVSETTTMSRCESSCLRNCACTAFAYNKSCLHWFGELWNTVVLDSGSNGDRMYIRIATEQQACSRASSLFSFKKKVVFVSVIGALALIAIGLIFLWRCRRKLFETRRVNGDGSLMIFSFVQIKDSTKGFSEKLGEGGFGCVFRATLPGCAVVAVKKLKGLRQEEKQFQAEVQTIGMIQHINIVRLLGFCAEGSRRFLVYEYMANGSLSDYLFSKGSSKLSWELRYSIALGVARGLAYLHEGCKDCILHCDIKPDNVLLDAEVCPKIADFGMAKLLGRDFSRALTTMRGTIGYLAPEWISGVPITHKADVYSYGMVLLEIISGRRNSEKIKEGKYTYFPTYAAVKLNEGDNVMCLLDGGLEGNADAEQVNRACRVACWCIQDAEDHRPVMGQVVRMLEGVMDVEVPPVPWLLQKYIGITDSTSADLGSF